MFIELEKCNKEFFNDYQHATFSSYEDVELIDYFCDNHFEDDFHKFEERRREYIEHEKADDIFTRFVERNNRLFEVASDNVGCLFDSHEIFKKHQLKFISYISESKYFIDWYVEKFL